MEIKKESQVEQLSNAINKIFLMHGLTVKKEKKSKKRRNYVWIRI